MKARFSTALVHDGGSSALLTLSVAKASSACSFAVAARRAQIGSKKVLTNLQKRDLTGSLGYLDPLIAECTLGTRSLAAGHLCCIVRGSKAGFVESFVVASEH